MVYISFMDTTHFLSPYQRNELIAFHRKERNARYADRIKTILWRDEGMSFQEIAHLLFLDQKTPRHWERVYREKGFDALLSDDYKPYTGKLDEEQKQELFEYVSTHLFLDVGPIIEHVRAEVGVSYSVSGMRDLLHRIGFSYKKPAHVPGAADTEKQRAFLESILRFMAVKSPDTPVLFMDSTRPSYNSMPSYGWIPTGRRVELPSTPSRRSVIINGVVNAETHEALVMECERLDAKEAILLLQKGESPYPDADSIQIITDNAGCYRAREVMEYLKTSRINLEYLPPYSPNLNLIERLWKFMRKHVLYNRYYPTFESFRSELLFFFERLSEEFSDSLRSLLTLKFMRFSEKEARMANAIG